MAPLGLRLLFLAVGASCVLLDADEADATDALRLDTDEADAADINPAGRQVGKRHRTGQEVARAPSGRSYIYIAGVPGTGLGYWTGALRKCADSKRCQPREFGFYTGMFFEEESQVNETWVKKDSQHSDRIVPMNLISPDLYRQGDDAFYRAFSNRLGGFENPRLPLYSKLATSNGDSLKVVVLTRDSEKELLAYNMKKFKLDAKEAEERLAADILTLASQVRELPVDSYRCMSFEDTLSLGENLEPLVKLGHVGTRTFAMTNRLRTEKDRFGCKFSGQGLDMVYECPHLTLSAPKVRAALDALEELCDPEDFVVTKSRHEVLMNSGKKIQWLVE